jgi:hypothetical protein
MAHSTPSAARGLIVAALVAAWVWRTLPAAPAAGGPPLGPSQPFSTWTSLFPPTVPGLRRCDEFDATVEGWGLADLAAFELELGFDPAVLEFTSAGVAPWLADRWSAYTELPPGLSDGNVLFAASVEPGSGSAGGDGELAVLRFRAIGAGSSGLDLHNVRLVSALGAIHEVTSTDAIAIVLDEDSAACVPTPTFTPEPPPSETPDASPTAGSATPTQTAGPPPTETPTATSVSSGTATPTQTGVPPSASPSATASGTDAPTSSPTASTATATQTETPESTSVAPSATAPPDDLRLFLPALWGHGSD